MTVSDSNNKRPIVWSNAAFLILTPVAAVVTGLWYSIAVGITWVEIVACVVLWCAVGLSVTAGYHRLFSHRSFEASTPVRLFFALLGAAAWENSIIAWAAAHRYHHRFVDTKNDPYNPQEGFWYSHMGWIMVEGAKHDDTSNVPDLWKDPICAWQHRHYLAISVITNLALTVFLGFLTGHMLGMFVFALLIRVVLTHHFTFLINSAAHIWGSQRWSADHSARDSWILSLFTFGEGYHNYHHTFQVDYRNGALWYNWDPSKWVIWTLSVLGLVRGLKRSHVDIRLDRLFSQTRQRLDEQFGMLGEKMSEIRELASVPVPSNPLEAMRQQVAVAEKRLEETLKELKTARTNFQAALRRGSRRLPSTKALRRDFRAAQKKARKAFRQWQQLGQDLLADAAEA